MDSPILKIFRLLSLIQHLQHHHRRREILLLLGAMALEEHLKVLAPLPGIITTPMTFHWVKRIVPVFNEAVARAIWVCCQQIWGTSICQRLFIFLLCYVLTDDGSFCRRDSSFLTDEDPNNVLSSMQNSMWGGEPFNPLLLTWLLNCLRRHDGSSSGRRRQVVIIMHLIGPLSFFEHWFIHPSCTAS